MHLCTVATHLERYMGVLQASCKRFGHELTVLGWGRKWGGLGSKLEWMLEHLQTLPDDDVVCFIDGFDVILLRSPAEMEQAFRESGQAMIVSADGRSPHRLVQFFIEKLFPRVDGVQINTGGYVAYVGHLRALLGHLSKAARKFDGNDQELVATFCAANKGWISIDTNSELFLNLYTGTGFFLGNDLDDSQLRSLRIEPQMAVGEDGTMTMVGAEVTNLKTGTRPFILHAPCDGNINRIVQALGYELPQQVLDYGAWDHAKYLWRNTKGNFRYIADTLAIALVVVVLAIVLLVWMVRALYRALAARLSAPTPTAFRRPPPIQTAF